MDWNLKIPSWDFTEFEQETIPTVDLTSGSSSLNFSVDLKLGQVIDSRNEFKDKMSSSSTSKMALSPSGSSKRARPVNNPIQGANCLVDGCKSDLTSCKEYHRRHKVCEIHSKTPEVSIHGQKQRFCQQCSRFHSLEEFDEGKRSCRKRLDGHNRRRRKPQPDTSQTPTLFSTHQGSTMIRFSSPQVYQPTTLTTPLWTELVKSGEEPEYLTNPNPFPESSSGIKKVTREQQQGQFSLFHNVSGSHLKVGQQQQLLSFGSNNRSGYGDGYPAPTRVVQPVVQSDCALSLLSSSPSQTTPNHVMHPPHSFTAPLDPGAGYGGLDSIMNHHVSPDDVVPPTLAFYWE